jgi:hypothetical protein
LASPLDLLKHCIILTADFWGVRAFFPAFMFSLLGWQQQRKYQRHSGSYIIKGWFSLNRPFLGVCGGVNTGG